MFPTKDGKKFGSAYVAKRRDAEKEKAESAFEGQHEAKETPEFEAGEKEGMQEQTGANADEIKSQHGPALSTSVHSDHTANEHHVLSHHKDGHVHHSKHNSSQDAHKLAAELAEESGHSAGPAAGGEAPESDGFSMPKLA